MWQSKGDMYTATIIPLVLGREMLGMAIWRFFSEAIFISIEDWSFAPILLISSLSVSVDSAWYTLAVSSRGSSSYSRRSLLEIPLVISVLYTE